MIAAYREPDRARGPELMRQLIDAISHGDPAVPAEITTLGRTLEHLRCSALGFRNLANYLARSLLETGGIRPRLHPRLCRAHNLDSFQTECCNGCTTNQEART